MPQSIAIKTPHGNIIMNTKLRNRMEPIELIEFSIENDSRPIFINPQYVIAIQSARNREHTVIYVTSNDNVFCTVKNVCDYVYRKLCRQPTITYDKS